MQPLHPARAVFAGILGFGYVYVGRIGAAFTIIACGVGLLALAGWTRLILEPWFLYALGVVAASLLLLQIVHPALIAARNPSAQRKRYNRWWFYVGWVILAQLGLEAVLASRAELFGYETFRVPSASMAPTLESGDFILVDSWRYSSEKPGIGDVVVYEDVTMSNITYVKRVVGLPGDHIEVRGGTLFRNGESVLEPYLHSSSQDDSNYWAPVTLTAGEYYLLGDNRRNSRDSRFHGPVRGSNIRGRVEYIWFSSAGWQRFPARLAAGT